MKQRRVVGLTIAFTIILGPWIWAFIAVQNDPKLADAQGAFTLATMSSMLFVPLGIAILILSFGLSKRK